MENASFKAACLSLGLATAWAAPLQADTIEGTVTSTLGMSNAYLLYAATNPNSSTQGSPSEGSFAERIGTVDPSVPTPYSFNLPVLESFFGEGDATYSPTHYTIVGVYNRSDTALDDGASVSIAFDSTFTNVLGTTFVDQFAGFNAFFPIENDGIGVIRQVTERDVQDALQLQNSTFLLNLSHFLFGTFTGVDKTGLSFTNNIGEPATLYNFSNATVGGSATAFVIVPEPGTASLVFGTMLVTLLKRSRRRPC